MVGFNETYQSIANVTLWMKIRNRDDLCLSDVPTIIPLRWKYFRDNWSFLKEGVEDKAASYYDPDFLNQQIKDFTEFIESQKDANKNINPFSDGSIFHKYYAIFDNITIESINLSNEEIRLVDETIRAVSSYSKNNFLKMRSTISDMRDRLADMYGLSDSDYNNTYGRNSIPKQVDPTIVEVNMLSSLQGSIKTIDFILANLFAVDSAIDPFTLARTNANNPEIDIGSYSSGKLVKLNYGEDLAGLATRYLGDPNKWIDIAIANGLKPPYIDEVGSAIPLLSNGKGNQINLSETDILGNLNIDKLYINQPVFLQSDIQVFPSQRYIINIKQIPVSGEIIIELDGESNLDLYQISDNANIRIYRPNTVNSSFYVLIPSTEPLDTVRKEEVPWFLAKAAEDEKLAGIDLEIDENGELNFTPNGDLRLSYGLQNAVQAVKLKIITELGSLRYHQNYGLINVIGQKNSNIDVIRDSIVNSLKTQIESDSRFDRIETLNVKYLASGQTSTAVSAIGIELTVRLAGGNKVIPISFTVNNV